MFEALSSRWLPLILVVVFAAGAVGIIAADHVLDGPLLLEVEEEP